MCEEEELGEMKEIKCGCRGYNDSSMEADDEKCILPEAVKLLQNVMKAHLWQINWEEIQQFLEKVDAQ